jgi:phospholipid transport system transporter-binding protein
MMIDWKNQDGVCWLAGELSKNTASQLWHNRRQLLRDTDILDLGDISKVDSAGVALLIALTAWAKQEGRDLKLSNPNENLLTLARVGDAIKVLRFIETKTSA